MSMYKSRFLILLVIAAAVGGVVGLLIRWGVL